MGRTARLQFTGLSENRREICQQQSQQNFVGGEPSSPTPSSSRQMNVHICQGGDGKLVFLGPQRQRCSRGITMEAVKLIMELEATSCGDENLPDTIGITFGTI